ncbi:hypothetical protein MIND_01016300 [Mycena indigotica]|uniref:Uncharacterized protein n=1 Tax=Mycena indigotica TaxID=2126181 RepID=A0A8H6S8C2_9AGAR|nr:uncharacterized protein MIND_01016300 [Mycena indigotica]KAF7294786.1 hypothetical protein MIND_01016300 [Mycena indigotica]
MESQEVAPEVAQELHETRNLYHLRLPELDVLIDATLEELNAAEAERQKPGLSADEQEIAKWKCDRLREKHEEVKEAYSTVWAAHGRKAYFQPLPDPWFIKFLNYCLNSEPPKDKTV